MYARLSRQAGRARAIGIFEGKRGKHNKLILKIIYDNGPLTSWELTRQIYEPRKAPSKYAKEIEFYGLRSLHPTIHKRLKALEKKKYVTQLKNRKWISLFKGILAHLITEPNPKPLGEAWYEWIPKIVPKPQQIPSKLRYKSKTAKIDISTEPLRQYRKVYDSRTDPKNFESWVAFADAAKDLMAQGLVNLDVIPNDLLIQLLIYRERKKEGFVFPIGLLDGKVEAIYGENS